MMKTILASIGIGTLALIGATTSGIAGSQAFSADAIDVQPGLQMRSGKVFKGAGGTRFEFQQMGSPIVQIISPDKKLMRVLFPLQRLYIELKANTGHLLLGARPDNPCKPLARIDCKKIKDEKMAGFAAELWTIKAKGVPGETRVWWNRQRKMPLREEYRDGRVMQAIMRGMEKYESLEVENWDFTFMSPDGSYRRAITLMSPKLELAVVERLPGGRLRRLQNISLEAPDAKLFEVPKGYKLMVPLQPPVNGAQSTPQQRQAGQGPRMGYPGAGPRGSWGGRGGQHHPMPNNPPAGPKPPPAGQQPAPPPVKQPIMMPQPIMAPRPMMRRMPQMPASARSMQAPASAN